MRPSFLQHSLQCDAAFVGLRSARATAGFIDAVGCSFGGLFPTNRAVALLYETLPVRSADDGRAVPTKHGGLSLVRSHERGDDVGTRSAVPIGARHPSATVARRRLPPLHPRHLAVFQTPRRLEPQ